MRAFRSNGCRRRYAHAGSVRRVGGIQPDARGVRVAGATSSPYGDDRESARVAQIERVRRCCGTRFRVTPGWPCLPTCALPPAARPRQSRAVSPHRARFKGAYRRRGSLVTYAYDASQGSLCARTSPPKRSRVRWPATGKRTTRRYSYKFREFQVDRPFFQLCSGHKLCDTRKYSGCVFSTRKRFPREQ
ncbi:hypothetical protein MRX96_040814 [Rhipicephalus microplus]